MGISAVQKFVSDKGAETIWDEEACQNYAEVQDGDSFYQVWMEDAQSLEVNINIMKNYNLGGVAAWKLGYEKGHPEVWDVLTSFVNG